MNSNADHTNYVTQDQIGASNAQDLGARLDLPVPGGARVPGLNVTGQGSISPPLVVNGTVYLVTNYLTVYAINGETGEVVWSYAPTLNTTGLPLGPLTGHMHGINYYRGDIWVSMPDCSVDGLNAVTGDWSWRSPTSARTSRGTRALRRHAGPSRLRRGHDDMDELGLCRDRRGAGLRRRL